MTRSPLHDFNFSLCGGGWWRRTTRASSLWAGLWPALLFSMEERHA